MGDDRNQKRSGTESRQRTKRRTIRFTEDEDARIEKLVEATHQSPGALLRNALLNAPLPRYRRSTIKDQAMSSYLAAAAKFADALRVNLAELGKSGSNLNQVAFMLNAGTDPARIMNIIESAVEEHRAALAKLNETMTDALEIRTMAMDALGLER
jgi:hypothetical protein